MKIFAVLFITNYISIRKNKMTMTVNQVREKFMKFFEGKGHTAVASSPVIPQNDKTLLFINAGMNQFKDIFLGKETRDYTRACSSQKCLRAGGKHNDLENVGYTNRHHTFFEMLGNFSFGDYFKEDAIKWAWTFITKEMKLPIDKLCITVYHTDDEAYNIWKEVACPDGLKEENIIRIATKDNFWEMGEVGPCGPCSEIFFDYGPEVFGDKPGTPDEDGDRWVEVWNLVFMQYEKYYGENGEILQKDLPKPCVDTGSGLERFSSVVQGKSSNYDTDLITNIKEGISKIINVDITPENNVLFNIVADHIRACSFALADGAAFSNEGQGYVIRKIIRRALGTLNRLGIEEATFYKFHDLVVKEMGDTYNELNEKADYIKNALKTEEELFLRTLGDGMKILDKEIANMPEGDKILKGETVFKLYDTYGLPSDIVRDVLKDKGLDIDEEGFQKAMEEQKARSRGAKKSVSGTETEKLWYDIKAEHGSTNFIGDKEYECDDATILNIDDEKMVFDKTPFYAESGGQVSDKGALVFLEGKLDILDVQKAVDGIFVHYYHICESCKKSPAQLQEILKVGDKVKLGIDSHRRQRIMAHHTGCHLLQAALKEVLGDHVVQRGSKVEQFKLHFDFSHGKGLTDEEKAKVEDLVNTYIDQKLPVKHEEMTLEEARKTGAIAPFDEKYGDKVKVLTIGEGENLPSIEFCGGTHIENTSKINCLVFEKDESISAGVRRVSMSRYSFVKAGEAVEFVQNKRKEEAEKAEVERQKQIAEKEAKKKAEAAGKDDEIKTVLEAVKIEKVNGISFIGEELSGISPKNLKPIADAIKIKQGGKKTVVLLMNENEGKVSIVASVSDDLTSNLSAVDLVRTTAEILGGRGGGGRPDMAQGGAASIENANDAREKVKSMI
jgi:alanyl-tRNA synthetase